MLFGRAYAVNLESHYQLVANPMFFREAVFRYNLQLEGILTGPGADFVSKLAQHIRRSSSMRVFSLPIYLYRARLLALQQRWLIRQSYSVREAIKRLYIGIHTPRFGFHIWSRLA